MKKAKCLLSVKWKKSHIKDKSPLLLSAVTASWPQSKPPSKCKRASDADGKKKTKLQMASPITWLDLCLCFFLMEETVYFFFSLSFFLSCPFFYSILWTSLFLYSLVHFHLHRRLMHLSSLFLVVSFSSSLTDALCLSDSCGLRVDKVALSPLPQ